MVKQVMPMWVTKHIATIKWVIITSLAVVQLMVFTWIRWVTMNLPGKRHVNGTLVWI